MCLLLLVLLLTLLVWSVGSSLQSPIEIIFPLVSEETELQSRSEDTRQDSVESPTLAVHESLGDSERSLKEDTGVSTEKPKVNILEVLKGMGHAFQLLMRQPHPSSSADQGDSRSDSASESSPKYREQAELLRSEINKRSGQLQRVVAAAIEANNDKDAVVKRILENLQSRLGQAKQRADKILKEPEAGELAVRTLNSINQGMGNLGNLVQHVLSRINISINFDLKEGAKSAAPAAAVAEPEAPLVATSSPANSASS